jgi:hypothetical protein
MPWRLPSGRLRTGLAARRHVGAEFALGMAVTVAGRSIRTQWKKSTRGSDAGTVASFLVDVVAPAGTSGSWQIRTKDLVPAGASLQRVAGCGCAQADVVGGAGNAEGIIAGNHCPSAKLGGWSVALLCLLI